MSVTVIGLNGFSEQPLQQRWVLNKGWETVRTWWGPPALAKSFADEVKQLYKPDSIDITDDIPAVVTAVIPTIDGSSIPDDTDPTIDEEWELDGVRLDKDLRSHPSFHKSGVSDTNLELGDQALKRGTATEASWAWSGMVNNMDRYISLRLRGTQSYLSYYWILRSTQTTSRLSTIVQAQTGIFSVFAYAGTGLPLNNPEKVKWAQPTIEHFSLGDAVVSTPINQWLKFPPVFKRGAKRKTIITQDYWGAEEWSGTLYNGGSGADALEI